MIDETWNLVMSLDNGTKLTSLIAILALGLTIWQGSVTRKHNRLTVKPSLIFFDNFLSDNHQKGLFIINNGVGPAIIKELTIIVNEKSVRIDNNKDDYRSVMQNLDLTSDKILYKVIPTGLYIPAQKNEPFLWAVNDNYRDPVIVKGFDALNYIIHYESVYGEKFEQSWK
ncbi:hypothetical protein GQR60_17115 [Labilibaculum sp. A4]|uniref:hypothetical protein n=1 Tax=Labilibaculum euxinus TaxID=2686357 RepID=UPI000F617B0A|nr:hypothetical protein [Labilibaculum euxinus]MDQ1772353.1 hypothetical protein [Labilibaculum euxinus]MWN78057.1 hypothetical protein [Labilibaculum euxinus]